MPSYQETGYRMNERIQLLAEQATTEEADGFKYFDKEKFAELIVLEMCKELDKAQWDKGEDWICADGTRIIPQIKEHFGVEE
jgi:hypothetical protein